MAIVYEKVVTEDLNRGWGNVSVTSPAGGVLAGTKIGIHSLISQCYNVLDFGADNTGESDCGEAIIAAAQKLQDAGGGTLIFPQGTYKVYSVGTEYTELVDLSSLYGVAIIADGAILAVDPDRTFSGLYGSLFRFAACTNISVRGLRVTGPTVTSSSDGIYCLDFREGCHDIDLPYNSFEGGTIVAVGFRKAYDDPDADRCYNIHIGTLTVKNQTYGISCQYSGDNMVVDNLYAENVSRSYFPYGIRGHRVKIVAKDCPGGNANIAAYMGVDTEDIDLTYIDRDSTASGVGNYKVMLTWPDTSETTIRNVKLNLDIRYLDGEQSGSYAVSLIPGGGTKHGLENLEISGIIDGTPYHSGAMHIQTADWAWETSHAWQGIVFRNLILINNTIGSRFSLGALTGHAVFDNVYSDQPIAITNTAADGAPETGLIEYRNCRFPNLYKNRLDILAGAYGLEVITAPSGKTIPAGYQGHTIANIGATGTVTYVLPAAVAGMQFAFSRIASYAVRVDPNGSEVIRGGGAGKYASLDTDGGRLHLRCHTDGIWDLISSYGTISYE